MNTPWTKVIEKESPLPEYPRPQMVRGNWINLNGLWDFTINPNKNRPKHYDSQIVVPFSPESQLSGICRKVLPHEYLWYRKSIELPDEFAGHRILLHIGAVDQETTVWINGHDMGTHAGGYLPIDLDITQYIESRLKIVIRVSDKTEKSGFSRGKQRTKSGGIWYTSISGIWQTVWLEAVPPEYVKSVHITPDVDNMLVHVYPELGFEGETRKPCYALYNGKEYEIPGYIPTEDCELWTPENPKLYNFKIKFYDDEVECYFAMRKISVEGKGGKQPRIYLNNKPYFSNGVLNQGYWPDGLYTPPCDSAIIHDITMAKDFGFNMMRLHMKIESLRWYYHCDRMGMLVWQDMPAGGSDNFGTLINLIPLFLGINIKDSHYSLFGRKDAKVREHFKKEVLGMVNHLYSCPCIVVWVPFNEGWGQFDSELIAKAIKTYDKSRLVDHASGWHDNKAGDLASFHVYKKSYRFKEDSRGRAVVLSEFGGYAYVVQGHTYNSKEYGYKNFDTPKELEDGFRELYEEQILPAMDKGLSACVYTQLYDVEEEINGLMTYDRRIPKLYPDDFKAIISQCTFEKDKGDKRSRKKRMKAENDRAEESKKEPVKSKYLEDLKKVENEEKLLKKTKTNNSNFETNKEKLPKKSESKPNITKQGTKEDLTPRTPKKQPVNKEAGSKVGTKKQLPKENTPKNIAPSKEKSKKQTSQKTNTKKAVPIKEPVKNERKKSGKTGKSK